MTTSYFLWRQQSFYDIGNFDFGRKCEKSFIADHYLHPFFAKIVMEGARNPPVSFSDVTTITCENKCNLSEDNSTGEMGKAVSFHRFLLMFFCITYLSLLVSPYGRKSEKQRKNGKKENLNEKTAWKKDSLDKLPCCHFYQAMILWNMTFCQMLPKVNWVKRSFSQTIANQSVCLSHWFLIGGTSTVWPCACFPIMSNAQYQDIS